ncbi:hypothetical protein DBR39_13820 [Chryseobacterium sp. KBW03]|uniref:hypothetical protein n=1 Tax=Chryseobacterium sp. KBW03 TaxID=2153362 RepID=UPI000F59370A|nr:hypothetical protein [Chryseobacterium sp. KBW03]RQO37960.1 hypothetical protein DBR39_13820 [Chryseobacterium sp. KBW03]
MKISKINLRNLFAKGQRPKQEAFYNWLDSYWHKDEEIDMTSVKNLESTLNNKLDSSVEQTLLAAVDNALAASKSLIRGEATPSSFPTHWSSGDPDLYEKWEVRTAGTYTNFKDSSGQPIVVISDDLDKKFVFINMTNGVAKKDNVAIPGVTAKTIFDPANNTEPSVMKAAYNASKDFFDKAISDKAGNGGDEVLGFGTTNNSTSNYAALRANNTPATMDGWITQITLKATAANTNEIGFHIIEPTTPGGAIFKNITGAISVGGWEAGVAKTVVLTTPIPIKKGQLLAIGVYGVDFNINTTTGSAYGFDGYTLFYKNATQAGTFNNNLSWCYEYKVETVGLTGDEAISLLKDLKKGTGGGATKSVFTNAESFGVSASNTAASNTAILNNLILNYDHIVLPSGIIKHTGLKYREGIIIEGQGNQNTTLLNESGTYAFQDLDPLNSNQFKSGGAFLDLTIDGGNIAAIGLELKNQFYLKTDGVVLRRFTNLCVKFTGVLLPTFNASKFQESKNGVYLTASSTSSAGYMQANMNHFVGCYFAIIDELCADLVTCSSTIFDRCNFESSGILNNNNTGAVRVSNNSPFNEGIDVVIMNGWSEGIRGCFLNLSSSTGRSNIFNQMIHRGGNGSAPGGTAIINNGCLLQISGGTKITDFTVGVVTNGGSTFVDGFSPVGVHNETNGGVLKTSTYT